PSEREMELSAWPGTMKTAAFTRRSPTAISTSSCADSPSQLVGVGWTSPRAFAVFGLNHATLSHVVLVIGSGSSCIQLLLLYRPSSILESAGKTISKFPSVAASEKPSVGSLPVKARAV